MAISVVFPGSCSGQPSVLVLSILVSKGSLPWMWVVEKTCMATELDFGVLCHHNKWKPVQRIPYNSSR